MFQYCIHGHVDNFELCVSSWCSWFYKVAGNTISDTVVPRSDGLENGGEGGEESLPELLIN